MHVFGHPYEETITRSRFSEKAPHRVFDRFNSGEVDRRWEVDPEDFAFPQFPGFRNRHVTIGRRRKCFNVIE